MGLSVEEYDEKVRLVLRLLGIDPSRGESVGNAVVYQRPQPNYSYIHVLIGSKISAEDREDALECLMDKFGPFEE
jgi:hypothetical protein